MSDRRGDESVDPEPIEVGKVLFAGICEGEAEIHKTGGKVCERDGDFLPGVPTAGWFDRGGANIVSIRSDGYGGSGSGGGITEGHFLRAVEPEAVVFGPMRMVDRSDEWLIVGVENLGAVVRGIGLGLDGPRMESDRCSSGDWGSLAIVTTGIGIVGRELKGLIR